MAEETTAIFALPASYPAMIDRAQHDEADPDWAVLARVAEGDTEAFGALVERHERRLLRLCERLLGDREAARDAAQEVFLKAFRRAGDYRPRGRVYTWLYRIAVNHCLNRLRRQKVVRFLGLAEAGHGEDDDAAELEPSDDAPDAEARLEARERWRATRRAIDKLPASQRAVVVLAKFEGLSYRRIAEVLEITEGAVESRLFRAMRRLEKIARA